ncbi:Protein of unknown function [Nitrosomonas cryotolerans]|uniref:DUF3047 domain-containing protein n=1 Tax=Nitrosomonas cryotolerans ATCC 49181 TaxID=1131553 RepID=A0A1N6J3X3_9PROT|nr:DUF3047 domain-containing protein [Nitrosomonas cryotolerans]SFQ09698.1 Protein of unknown function [Nitrosomonas cryotolerans]SIO38941.1 Protein of unknown function [Nitrosomonas cryotolerans ATCC 49181]
MFTSFDFTITMKKAVCGIIVALPILSWAGADYVYVVRFSQGDMSGWQEKVFIGETRYVLQNAGEQLALRADSHASASGRYRKINIDLDSTSILNWMWRVDNTLGDIDERTRMGDDYAARVYVVFSNGWAFWHTRSINYVWSSNQPVGAHWPNALTPNVRMIAIESGNNKLGQWIKEKRDVHADFQHLFGEVSKQVDAVAIMTDTDNTGGTATAWYGDIWFSSR